MASEVTIEDRAVARFLAEQRVLDTNLGQPLDGLRQRGSERKQTKIGRQEQPDQEQRADQAEQTCGDAPADDPTRALCRLGQQPLGRRFGDNFTPGHVG
jgi:hypothetical protein